MSSAQASCQAPSSASNEEMLEAALEHACGRVGKKPLLRAVKHVHEPADDRILVSEVGQMRQGRKILPDDFR